MMFPYTITAFAKVRSAHKNIIDQMVIELYICTGWTLKQVTNN